MDDGLKMVMRVYRSVKKIIYGERCILGFSHVSIYKELFLEGLLDRTCGDRATPCCCVIGHVIASKV